MSFRMDLWAVEEGGLQSVQAGVIDLEKRLEDWIAKDPGLTGLEVVIIGRQVTTEYGGKIDLLALDREGGTVLFELKRGKTPRNVVAQLLDYASWIGDRSFSDLDTICRGYKGVSLSSAYSDAFDEPLPETVNGRHSLVVVAPELDESSERIIQYLAEEHGLPISAVFFNVFYDGAREFLGRAWLSNPEDMQEKAEGKHKPPWKGYWFVNVGEGESRSWDDCRRYGLLSAGGDPKYSKPLKKLQEGDPVFAYMKGLGYVGFGTVTSEAVPITDFVVSSDGQPLLEHTMEAEKPDHHLDDPEFSEWVVGVEWSRTFSREEARTFKGAFANQNVVCKLRHPPTVEFLEKEWEVGEGK